MQSLDDCNYQCSELVSVLYEDSSQNTHEAIANLEEISAKTATLLFENQPASGAAISFRANGHDLYGVIESTDRDPILGWFAKIRLHRLSRWSARMFVPEHFLALCASASVPPVTIEIPAATKVFTRNRNSGY
jgi:hypothetical protein